MPVDTIIRSHGERDPGTLMIRELEALTGGCASVTLIRERAWASITFAGTRYCFALEWADAAGPDALQKVAQILPDHEFAIPGYFVADILVTEQSESHLLVEALLITDPVDNSRSV